MTNKLFDFNTNSWQEVEIQPFDMEYYLQQKPTLTTGQYAQHVGVEDGLREAKKLDSQQAEEEAKHSSGMTNKLFDFNTNSWQEVEIQPFDMEYYLQQKPTLTTGQYAQHVGVSSKTIRQWCREGKLKSTRTPGGHNRFSLDSFYSEDATIYKLPYGQQ